MVIDIPQILAQIIDGDSLSNGSDHPRGQLIRFLGRFEIRDSFPQYGYEIAHDMSQRILYREDISIQVLFGNTVSNLSGQADIQLRFWDIGSSNVVFP